MGRSEVGWDALATPEVHLVGGLASEGGVRDDGIVLVDVERDQLLQASESVELVQGQPAMLERTPESLNHGIREADLNLGKNPTELAEFIP